MTDRLNLHDNISEKGHYLFATKFVLSVGVTVTFMYITYKRNEDMCGYRIEVLTLLTIWFLHPKYFLFLWWWWSTGYFIMFTRRKLNNTDGGWRDMIGECQYVRLGVSLMSVGDTQRDITV